MPSSKYIATTMGNRVKGLSSTSKGSDVIGGAVPLLLKNIIQKTQTTGGSLEVKSNVMVGTVTSSAPSRAVGKTSGGELLNKIQQLKFGKGTAQRKNTEGNIKFIF